MLIVVMGVSGCGKSTLGKALSKKLGMAFIDADDLHPQSNIEKMRSGFELTDEDRFPWLLKIRAAANEHSDASGHGGLIIACSALKHSYRDVLRGLPSPHARSRPLDLAQESVRGSTYFVFMDGDKDVLKERLGQRQNHFMKAGMLDGQLRTLEDPRSESGVVVVPIEETTEGQVRIAEEALSKLIYQQSNSDTTVIA